MADFEFYVDIEDSSGNKLGGGPLTSVSRWQYTSRFDRAGAINFDFAASDPQASTVQNRRIARAFALINDVWVEVGAGVIDEVGITPTGDGRVSLNVSGLDLIRELGYRTVGTLEVGAGSGATHSAALTAIGALAPVGWTFTPAVSPDNDYIYARYGGESVLGALVHLAERTQTHFYRSVDRTLVFTSAFTSSGVRAIQARGDLVPETCAIVSLRRTVDTHDLLTRITPYGSGQGNARLTLAATSRAAPVGYTLDAANNYIENDDATTAYGLVDFPEIEFKEIGPISNTDPDLEAAADMLFDAALEELTRRSSLADQETYSLTVAGCSQLLRPMQTIRLVYRDLDQDLDINDDLYILEATWEVDESGVRTSQLVVSTDDRWPVSDTSAAAERAVEGRVFQAHPQLNANAYVTAYTKNVDENEIAEFRFRFGAEVVNLQQVLFEFQILQFESTVRSVASASATTSSGGSATPTSSSGGGDTVAAASGGGTTPTTSSGGSSTPTSSFGGASTPTSSSGGAISATSGFFTNEAAAVNTGNGTDGGTDVQDTTAVVGAPGSYSDSHIHWFDVSNHWHSATLRDHQHSVTAAAHTHTVAIGFHTHNVDISAHTHTVTVSAHTHGVTISNHTHTVTIAAHTHTVTPSITTEYGIFREDLADTYALNHLDYRVNGGSWLNCEDDAVDAGSDWWQIDITTLVMSATTYRPLQANNLLEIRSLTANKTATIDAQLSVRSTIQAIAYL
jgi:hypothetical protein